MLKIGYDAKRLFNNFTGLGNYSRTLLRSLSEYYPDHAYYLYTPKITQSEDAQFFLNNPSFTIRMPQRKWYGAWWRTTGVKRDLLKRKLDLYHGLSHEIPVGIRQTEIKSVVTIHDLIFKRYPHHYTFIDRAIYNSKFKYACENADRIVSISESTKKDIVDFYGIEAGKIDVIYQSCHDRFKQQRSKSSINEVLAKYNIPSEFLLYVGSLTERKNLLGILKAYEILKQEEWMPLVVVGKGGEYKKKVLKYIAEKKLTKMVKFVNVHDDELPALYQAAAVFIYLSYCEGFGLPIIEALFSQTPVITSNVSSLPEAAGPDSLLISPEDTEALVHALRRILSDSQLRNTCIKKGYGYAQKFSTEPLTTQLMQTYQEVLQSKLS